MGTKTVNWDVVRESFPAAQNNVFLNSAANSPLHTKVYQKGRDYLEHLYREGEWDYWKSLDCIGRTREKMARFIGAETSEVGFGPNTSHNMNLLAMMFKEKWEKSGKNKIVLCADEFPSSSFPWEAHGFHVIKVPSRKSYFDTRDFLPYIDDNVAAVVISHVQFGTGLRSDLKVWGDFLEQKKIPMVINATQSLGSFPVEVKAIKATALVASCHKRMGAGTGLSALYLKKELIDEISFPLTGWQSVTPECVFNPALSAIKKEASAIETGVVPFSTFWALEASLDVLAEIGIENIAERTWELSNLCEKILHQHGLAVLSYRDREESWQKSLNSANILFAHPRAQELFDFLNGEKIYVSLRAGGVRVSLNYFNNEEDINKLIAGIRKFER